ncbi:MAG: Hpt domain-containing protein, partial [Lachnospiraceae bacterium]|nr:Hpt domain-containing protein [Lachnospiraceae bacterium]
LKRVLPKNAVVYTKEPIKRKKKEKPASEPVVTEALAAEPKAPEAVPVVEAAPEGPYASLTALGVDMAHGIDYCGGDTEFYDELLEDYASKKDEKLTEIQGYFDNEDWENYEIRVHGIKSTSALIGATGLSEKAKSLEFAAKDNNIQFIHDNHADMKADYEKLLSTISELF